MNDRVVTRRTRVTRSGTISPPWSQDVDPRRLRPHWRAGVIGNPVFTHVSNSGDKASSDEISEPQSSSKTVPRRIRVLLADDHAIMREGLAALLADEPDIKVVAEATDGLASVEMARRYKPDVIIMDISMPRMSGIEATRCIVAEFPDVRIIALSMHEKDDMASAMRSAGAQAYLTKGGPVDALIAAIRGTAPGNGPPA